MSGIYIHIPFCKKSCTYCNFYFSTGVKYRNVIVKAIQKEIYLRRSFLKETITTIYFGGGTPSLLSPNEILEILETIFKNLSVVNQPEITIEVNPDDISKNWLHALRATRVNRLSIGIQSFYDMDLKYLHRLHDGNQAEGAIKAAQDTGYSNISVDLIYGIPTSTNIILMENIFRLIRYKITHVSAYALTVEPGTALKQLIKKGSKTGVSESKTANQYAIVYSLLSKNKYSWYEISNYAKPGGEGRHNSNYWRGKSYLGLGPSAHSYNGKTRQWNVSSIAKYIESLNSGKLLKEEEKISRKVAANELILTGIRTKWGINIQKLKILIKPNDFSKFLHRLSVLEENMFIKISKDTVLVTEKGKLYADGIGSEMFID